MRWHVQNLLILTIAGFFLASGVVVFFAPHQIVTGGPPGIGIMLEYLLHIPVGLTVFIINFSLMLLGAKRYGRGYFFRTVYAIVVSSTLIEVLRYLFPDPTISSNLLLNVVIGSITLGLGIALCFKGNAASGGMATAAQLLAERTGLKIGRVIQIMDGTIVLLSAIVFRNIESALWAGLGVIITGFVINWFMRRQGR